MIDKSKYEKDTNLVCKEISLLTPLMQSMVEDLIKSEPMLVVCETWRSNARQHKMFTSGKSKTDTSLHEEGKSVDYFHRKLGYKAPVSWWMNVRKSWKAICIKNGYPKVCFPTFELGHVSINNGERC